MADTKDAASKKLAATQAFVTKQFKVGKQWGAVQGGEEVLEVHRFATEPARVEVSLGVTVNLGNFESAKLSIGVVVPCYKEETEEAFTWAKNWVESKVMSEVERIREKRDTNLI